MDRRNWIRLKSPRERVHSVCERMLRSRLEAIAHYLPLAAKQAQESIEYVHQLRVWTRRADAVVDLCRKLLRKRDRRELRRQLGLLRDAAGAARDADVLLGSIARLSPGLGRDHLLKTAQGRRREAQEPIQRASQLLGGGQQLLKLGKRIRRRFQKNRREKPLYHRFAPWAAKHFHPLIKRFINRSQKDLHDPQQLHKFRIAGKRLRYGLELVWGILDKRLRRRAYRQVRRLQMELGTINDRYSLLHEIERALAACKKRPLQAQLRRLLAVEHRRQLAILEAWIESWSKKKSLRLERLLKRIV